MLHQLATGAPFIEGSNLFHHSVPELSLIFQWTVNWIHQRWHHLLDLDIHNPLLSPAHVLASAKAIAKFTGKVSFTWLCCITVVISLSHLCLRSNAVTITTHLLISIHPSYLSLPFFAFLPLAAVLTCLSSCILLCSFCLLFLQVCHYRNLAVWAAWMAHSSPLLAPRWMLSNKQPTMAKTDAMHLSILAFAMLMG